jgi:hypothetical protein
MGLDMYLTKKYNVGAKYDFNNVKGKIEVESRGVKLPVDFNKVKDIEEEVAYWRKANAIHNWFVQNVQDGKDDCGYYQVTVGQLNQLLELCKEVKRKVIMKDDKVVNGQTLNKNGEWEDILENGKIITNPEEIANILPTISGFFFGSTAYDEYYMMDIDYTIEVLEAEMNKINEYEENHVLVNYYYSSSW